MEKLVALEKNELVYMAGLAIIFLWDVIQAIAVYDNSILLFFSLLTLAITACGAWGTLSDIDSIRNTWMLWYVFPAGLIGLAGVQGHAEFQNSALSAFGLGTVPLPLEGTSKDYTAAAYSHYMSMCAPAAAWVVAYLAPLAHDLYRKVRA
jgi:hypothetical protein